MKFLIRAVLGLFFGFLLAYVFFPASSKWLGLILAGLFVLFAYGLEFIRNTGGR